MKVEIILRTDEDLQIRVADLVKFLAAVQGAANLEPDSDYIDITHRGLEYRND